MDQILIPFKSDNDVTEDIISVTLNSFPIDFKITNNCIVIDRDISFGVNLLKISLIKPCGSDVKLQDFSLNGASARHTFFLSFYTAPTGKKEIATWLSSNTSNITIPFGNPISYWLTEAGEKFCHGQWGTNLYEKYEVFYPESVEVNSAYPRLMRDFMKYSFSFHAYLKDDLKDYINNKKNIPWLRLNIPYDHDTLLAELEHNIDLLESNPYVPTQNKFNVKESPELKLWHVAATIPTTPKDDLYAWKKSIVYSQDKFPELHKLLTWISDQGIRIDHAFISQVKPMSYVAPHRDNYYRYDSYKIGTEGCTQITVPLGFTPGNWFKFDNAGMVPTDCATLLNSSEFMHGSVNQSDRTRFFIGVYCQHFDNTIMNHVIL